jgi:hypothetical protein
MAWRVSSVKPNASPRHPTTTIATLMRRKTARTLPFTASCPPAKQKNSVRAIREVGLASWQLRRAGGIVQAQFERRSVLAGIIAAKTPYTPPPNLYANPTRKSLIGVRVPPSAILAGTFTKPEV